MRILDPATGEPCERIAKDPRWSSAQVDAAVKAAQADPEARIAGLDTKMRPVVNARLSGERATYALLRNGNPAKPVMPFHEVWRSRRTG